MEPAARRAYAVEPRCARALRPRARLDVALARHNRAVCCSPCASIASQHRQPRRSAS
jgi:hypothetical protein